MTLVYFNSKSFKDIVKLSPVQLNEGEKILVQDLKHYYQNNQSFFENKELYLLRNLSKKGIGFFEANNFFPDFILWLLVDGKQFIKFIDPKGLRQVNGFDNPKIKFHKVIQDEIQPRLNDPEVNLESFIISNTSLKELKHWKGQESIEDFNTNNVYFQKEQKGSYISKILES